MKRSQADTQSILVFDPVDGVVETADSPFYQALFETFAVEQAEDIAALATATTDRYAAVVYRWRSGQLSDLTAILSELPETVSVPFVVAGPDNPSAVRNALVTEADDYVSATETAAETLKSRLSDSPSTSKTPGIEAADTATLNLAIVQQMQDTAWVLDSTLRVSYVNEQVVERTGLKATELIGQPLDSLAEYGLLTDATYRELESGLTEIVSGVRDEFRIQLAVQPPTQPSFTTDLIAMPFFNHDGEIVGVVGIGRDITSQLAEHRQMERQNDLFREAQQLADVGSWALDTETERIEITDEIYSIYELADGVELTLDDVLALHPEHNDELIAAFDGLRAGEKADLEAKAKTPQGTDKWVRIYGTPTEVDGEVTEILGAVQDITGRRQLEAELTENVASLRQLYEVSTNTSLSFEDRIGRVLETACERLGLSYGFLTAIADDVQEIVYAHGDHEKLRPGERAALSTAYCRKTIEQDALLRIEDATAEGWADDPAYQTFGLACYIGGKVTVSGRLYGTLCFADSEVRDRSFTETERAFIEVLTKWVSYQIERRETESKLRALQETTQAFLTAPDEETVAALAMDAAVEILELPLTGLWRYSESEKALLPIHETKQSDEVFDEQPRIEAGDGLLWEAFAENRVLVFDDVQADPNRYNTETKVKSEVIVPVQSYGVLASATLEKRSFSTLEVDLLRILATSLSTAMVRVERKKELEAQNDRLSTFTGYVSHDLRNPLAIAQGYVEEAINSGDIERLDAAVRAHDRMEQLIEDMLLLSRRGEVIGETAPTDVAAVAQTAWNTVKSTSATFSVSGSVSILADESRLQQVFENLFRNSVEHGSMGSRPQADDSAEHGGGGIHIAVECEPDRLVITDDGQGFDTDPTGLFDRDADGIQTGLGLSIIAEIVKAHGWSITVENRDPTGTRFEITGFEQGVNDATETAETT